MFRISVYTGGLDKKPHIHTQEKENKTSAMNIPSPIDDA